MVSQPATSIEILCFIVNHGKGKKIIKAGKKRGVKGATIFLGRGSKNYQKRWLEKLDLSETRKEIVFMLASTDLVSEAVHQMKETFQLDKPHQGIAFRMSVSDVFGSGEFKHGIKRQGGFAPMYKAIFTIVDRGSAEDVMKAANEVGQKGGTIFKARGAGVHETQKLFNMEIAPEKEVVLLLTKVENADKVTAAIRETMNIDEPGKGMIFIQDVHEAYGLFSQD